MVGRIEVITDYLIILISDQISAIFLYKLSSDWARRKLPASILVGMIEVISDYLTILIGD